MRINGQCTLTCPVDTVFKTNPDTSIALIPSLLPTYSGCGTDTLWYTLSGATNGTGGKLINKYLNLGLTNVTYHIGVNSCNFRVFVKDLEAPDISKINNINRSANPDQCNLQVYYNNPSTNDNTQNINDVIQYFEFSNKHISEITQIGWVFNGLYLSTSDKSLKSGNITNANPQYLTTSFYKFNSSGQISFKYRINNSSRTISLNVYSIDKNNNQVILYSTNITNTNENTANIFVPQGFYKILIRFSTTNSGTTPTINAFVDDLFIKAKYANHTTSSGDNIPVEPNKIFLTDSTYKSGDYFPTGTTKLNFKVVDFYGNYSVSSISVSINGGANIINGKSIVDENTIQTYWVRDTLDSYNWVVNGGTIYSANGDSAIQVYWTSAGTKSIRLDYTYKGSNYSSCNYSVYVEPLLYKCFQYRRMLTINHNLVFGTQTNFPVLFYKTHNDFKHSSYGGHIQHPKGYDIYFSSDSQGKIRIPHELDYYDPVSGTIAVWVLMPSINNTTDVNFYIHYGNANIDKNISSPNFWPDDFVGVYHMDEDLKDYSIHNDSPVNYGTEIRNGRIGKARNFVRTEQDEIVINNEPNFRFTTEMTISFWVYLNSFPSTTWMDIIIKSDNKNYRFVTNSTDRNIYYAFNNGSGPGENTLSAIGTFVPGNWYYVSGVFYGPSHIKRMYLRNHTNGSLLTYNTTNYPYTNLCDGTNGCDNQPVQFGLNSARNQLRALDGYLDEVRLSNKYHDDNWIKTDFNTQNLPETFIIMGQEQTELRLLSQGGTANIYEDYIYASYPATGILTNYNGTVQWQVSEDKINFRNISGATSANLYSEPVLTKSYFRAFVSNNGCSSVSNTDSVNVMPSFISCDYKFRRKISIDPSKVPGTDNLTNFPLLISFDGVGEEYLRDTIHGGNVCNQNGYDIVFTSSDGVSLLRHEIQEYNPATGLYIAWVRVPSLKALDTTKIFMYYGKKDVTENPSIGGVWGSEYIGVWHLDNNLNDVAGGNNGSGNSITFNTGKIGTAAELNSTRSITVPNENKFDIPANGAITISCWMNLTGFTSSNQPFIAKGTDTWILRRDGTNNRATFADRLQDGNTYYIQNPTRTIQNSQWHYVCASYNSFDDAMSLYIDGTIDGTRNDLNTTSQPNQNSTSVIFGPLIGRLDEVRISNVYRSQEWIYTEYLNQNNPEAFYTVSNSEDACNASPVTGITGSEDTVVCKGRNAVIILHNAGSRRIYWQKSENNIDWEYILGATDSIYITPNINKDMYYRALISEECCSNFSPSIFIRYKNIDPPQVSIYAYNESCSGRHDGQINIIPKFIQPLIYKWSNGYTSKDIKNLYPGDYRVTITNTTSYCNLKEERTIETVNRVEIILEDITGVSCKGNDGAIDISVNGGTLSDIINFNGSNYIRIADDDSLDETIASNGTIEVRFLTKDTTLNTAILYKGNNNTNRNYSLNLAHQKLIAEFRYGTGSSDVVKLQWDSIKINRWYHVAFAWQNDSVFQYINGRCVNKNSKPPQNLVNNSDSFYIAKPGRTASQSQYFKGYIKEIKIWNRRRNEIQIKDSMYLPLTGREENLMAYYKMNESGQDTIFNYTSNKNIHGAIVPSNIGWIKSDYEYLWSNDKITQDINALDTGSYLVNVKDNYGCSVDSLYRIRFLSSINVPPSPPSDSTIIERYGEGPVMFKVYGPKNNCPDSAVAFRWYLTPNGNGSLLKGNNDSLYYYYLTTSDTLYVASVNFAGRESNHRTQVIGTIIPLDSGYFSLRLPENNSYVNFGNFEKYKPTNYLTAEFWIKPDTLINGNNILRNGWNNSVKGGFGFIFENNKLNFVLRTDNIYNVSAELKNHQWQHVAATYDGNKLRLYINGKPVDSTNVNGTITYYDNGLIIGNEFVGNIDDIKIWNVTLNQKQIKTLMFQMLNHCTYANDVIDHLDLSNLVFYCNFDKFAFNNTVIIPNNLLSPGILFNQAQKSTDNPYDNWFPYKDKNLANNNNWYSNQLPNITSPGYAIINQDTALLAVSDLSIKGLVLKKYSAFKVSNNGINHLSISGNIYDGNIELRASEINTSVESYSSFDFDTHNDINLYSIDNKLVNLFDTNCICNGLRGFYFNNNNFTDIASNRCDSVINFNWHDSSPDENITNDNDFSVLWIGKIIIPQDNDYKFYLTSSGKVRMWINNKLILKNFTEHSLTTDSAYVYLSSSITNYIIIEYSEENNDANIKLEWEYSGNKEVIGKEWFLPFINDWKHYQVLITP
jgi:hypothetical protein